jgi:LuxR family transcriptional regulator, maltose regulon positive regulatory protein
LERKQGHLPTQETIASTSLILQNPLVATKFFVPAASHTLIARPRLTALLDEGLEYSLTLVSAPAGSGKTTLLAAWGRSLPANNPLLAWVSLDEGDNNPRLFWTCLLSALNRLRPERFTPVLKYLQSSQDPSLKYVLRSLINLLAESRDRFLLILDDYHVIIEQEVHNTLLYLVEHIPLQLRVILATRVNPPLPIPALQARQQLLQVRTEQLRCTVEETRAFFRQLLGIQLPDETIQQVTARTEGWMVGLQLLALSVPERVDPVILLKEACGNQRYILDYLTEEVLRRQPQNVQMFLLSTCILEKLTASLCDAVMQQDSSQQMLEWLEQVNLFVVSLDSRRHWYRYHTLFAEALRYQLEQMHADLVPILHHHASLWYAQHGYTIEAILHACSAKEWQWAADLIERLPLTSISERKMSELREWLEQLPADIVCSRPRLCLACAQILWAVSSQTTLEAWFDAAETMLTTSLAMQTNQDVSHTVLTPKERQEQENLLGEVIAFRAILCSHQQDGQAALSLCQKALSLLSAKNSMARAQVSIAQLQACYVSSANDAVVAVQSGLQAGSLAQAAGQTTFAITVMGTTAMYMIGTGRLHEAERLSQRAILLGTQLEELVLPEVGYPAIFQAEILREWNQLDEALSRAEEAIKLCRQSNGVAAPVFLLYGYMVLMRIFLSRRELDAACSALREVERIGASMNQPTSLHVRSLFSTIDQVRLWLACGELDRASRWAELLEVEKWHSTPFAREREEVARARLFLAKHQPDLVLERLEMVLQRAMAGQRWGHVIEVRLLQALAYQMHEEETLALSFLSEAVRLAEPEGYICSFVDEGPPMAALLSRLRKEQYKAMLTPYLDIVLAAFPRQSAIHEPQTRRVTEPTIAQMLQDPLSEREREVLRLLAQGASNQEIAQELVIVVDTVKRHVSQILSKLAVKNRLQAVRQARALGLLGEASPHLTPRTRHPKGAQ